MSNADHTVTATPYHERIVGSIRPALLTLIAPSRSCCSSAARPGEPRADGRQREVAIRAALGAGIFQQLIVRAS